jgi:hypothetical protein
MRADLFRDISYIKEYNYYKMNKLIRYSNEILFAIAFIVTKKKKFISIDNSTMVHLQKMGLVWN